MKTTNVFHKLVKALNDKKRLIVNYGGSRSSKTYSTIQLFKLIAEKKPNTYLLILSSTIPKVKKTVLRDFIEIMGTDFNYVNFNKQELKYEFSNGSVVQFSSADMPDNFKGLKTHYALLDEINTYRNGEEILLQIKIRNLKAIIATFNPTIKFWIANYFDKPNTEIIHSTYKDNQYLEVEIIKELEALIKTNANFYKVYALGEWGEIGNGLINIDWLRYYDINTIDVNNFDLCIDTAYTAKTTNDPSAIIKYQKKNNAIYVIDVFQHWLEFPDLKKKIIETANPNAKIFIEPKASGLSVIQELRRDTMLNVIEDKSPTSDKISRLNGVINYIESGRLLLPNNATWLTNYVNELITFPNGVHDDQVDVTVMALTKLSVGQIEIY